MFSKSDDNLILSCATASKQSRLQYLEPSGDVQTAPLHQNNQDYNIWILLEMYMYRLRHCIKTIKITIFGSFWRCTDCTTASKQSRLQYLDPSGDVQTAPLHKNNQDYNIWILLEMYRLHHCIKTIKITIFGSFWRCTDCATASKQSRLENLDSSGDVQTAPHKISVLINILFHSKP